MVGAVLHVNAADTAKPGFQPLTPDGYPINPSNLPAAIVPGSPAPQVEAIRPATIVAATNTTSSTELDDRHKLVPGDKLSFTILEDRFFPNLSDNRYAAPAAPTDLSKPLLVADTGELDMPYVGRVMVAGRTCKDVAAEVKVLLEKDYYKQATVVLGLDQMSREQGRVWISGEVRSPGAVMIPPTGNFTAGKAILAAGGFTEWAKETEVLIMPERKVGDPPSKSITVDMHEVLTKGRSDKDVPVNPEDRIIVPRKKIRI
jgi:protein involved in polysaccharide export with SLBB domain